MDLSIIIVNWKSAAWVRGCLASIYANAAGMSLEVIVVTMPLTTAATR